MSFRRLTLLLLAFAACTQHLRASGTFDHFSGDGGGWFTGFALHPGGRVYGRTDVGGAYRSDDGAASWHFLSGGFTTIAGHCVQGIACASNNADVVFLALGVSYENTSPERGVWRSTNGGGTWTQVLAGVNFSGNDAERWGGECIAFRPGIAAEVWAGSRGDGLWRTLNGGTSWTAVANGTFDTPNVPIAGITFHAEFTNQVWVCGAGGVWVSTNTGVTWTNIHAAERVYRVTRRPDGTTFFAGVNSGATVLFRVTSTNWNNPATYTKSDLYPAWGTGLPWVPGGDFALVTLLSDGSLVAGNFFNFTRRSWNSGSNWTTLSLPLEPPLAAWDYPGRTNLDSLSNHLVQDPVQTNRWYAAGGFGPARSTNGGASWRHAAGGVGEIVCWRVQFDASDSNRLFLPAADLGGAFLDASAATNRLRGFVYPHFPWPDDNIMFTHAAWRVGTNRWLAFGGDQGSGLHRVYVTDNLGTNWSRLAPTGLPAAADRTIIDALPSRDNPSDLLVYLGRTNAAGGGGVYRSTNAAASFTQSTGLPAGAYAGDLFYWEPSLAADATNQAVRYLMLRNSGFYRSTNRGASWNTTGIAQPPSNYARLRVDAVTGRLWAAPEFNSGPYFSTNGGASWVVSTNFASTADLDARDGRIAAIARRPGESFRSIYYSPDNGSNWIMISNAAHRFGNATAVAIDPWRTGVVWVSTSGRTLTRYSPWTPIESWRALHFGSPTNAGAAANTANPDGDAAVNLMEFALGRDPNRNDSDALTLPAWHTNSGTQYFSILVPRATNPPGIVTAVEVSSDLATWTTAGLVTVTNSPTLLHVRDDTPATNAARRFLRFRASE